MIPSLIRFAFASLLLQGAAVYAFDDSTGNGGHNANPRVVTFENSDCSDIGSLVQSPLDLQMGCLDPFPAWAMKRTDPNHDGSYDAYGDPQPVRR